MIIKYFSILIILLTLIQLVYGQQQQQPSVIWDENTKSWVSVPSSSSSNTAVTATTPSTAPQAQTPLSQQVPTLQQQPQIIQTVPTSAGSAPVDLGTLMTVITPILAAISGIFIKNRKDMEKKEEELKRYGEKKDGRKEEWGIHNREKTEKSSFRMQKKRNGILNLIVTFQRLCTLISDYIIKGL